MRTTAARLARSCGVRLEPEPGAGPAPTPSAAAEREQVTAYLCELDRAGAAVQSFAQDLAEARAAARDLAVAAAAVGLHLDGLRVREPYGVASADHASSRLAEIPALQRRADRIATAIGRSRATLRRRLASGSGVLRSLDRPEAGTDPGWPSRPAG